tara:strand:+ start:2072 stop:2311 length:240 start_codon:yes stop_codon:yes gene_type:complete
MAQYKADIIGNRGGVSRLGHKTSGLECWVRGWSSGVEVIALWNEEKEEDEFHVYVTGGSGSGYTKKVGIVNSESEFIIK